MSRKPEKKRVSVSSIGYVLRNIIWPRKKLVLLGLFLIIANRLSALVLPGASKYLIDEVITKGNTSFLYKLLFAVGGAVLVQSISSFSLTRLLSVEAQYLISILRLDIYKHVVFLPVRFFDNTKTGELVSRIMTDVEGVRNLVGTGLVQLFGGILTAIVALSLLLRINALMTLYVVVPLFILGVVTLKAFGYIRPIFRERRRINADVTGRLTESLGAVRVIKGFNAESQEVNVFERGVERLFLNVKKSLTATSLVTSSATLLLGMTAVAMMAVGSRMIMNGRMTIGDFFAFALYMGFLITPVVQMSNIGSQMTEAFAGLDRTEELLSTTKEGEETGRINSFESVKGDVEFNDVTFAYEKGNPVVKNISFSAPAGTVTALVGASGSGKTTIAGLAASFLSPEEGKVMIDGFDLETVKLDSYRSHLGVVLQDDFLYEGTIRENILFSRPDASEKELLDAVAAAHVDEFTDRFDDGLDTLIGERGVKLSGGQRQRVTIARAILADPRILILDEATSDLDTESELYIQRSLTELLKGRTTFVIAHRLSTIRRADQILVIEHGEVVERGTHDELIEKEGRYYQLYTYQARI
jgi:subfamily B ATP-binding cassette protein MsbA